MTRITRLFVSAALFAVCSPAAAQQIPSPTTAKRPPGWQVTPALTSGVVWDDNVLIRERNDDLVNDRTMVLTPGGSVDFVGGLGDLSASYAGSFQRYRSFDDLDSYDQTASLVAHRRTSPRTTFVLRSMYSAQPTTALPALIGIPFTRTGSRILEVRPAGEAWLTKRTQLLASYDFQYIRFDKDPEIGRSLLGGTAHGGTAELRHRHTRQLTLTGAYDIQRASLVTGDRFLIQNTWAGAEYQIAEATSVFGAAGVSHLDATDPANAATSPAWRAGLMRRVRNVVIDASYSRSFLPSYGAGGTLSNEEVSAQVVSPLTRKLYTDLMMSWRRNAPLISGTITLHSLWTNALLGYRVRPWIRVEGFYSGLQQDIDRPGGRLLRNRYGFQIVTATPMRIR